MAKKEVKVTMTQDKVCKSCVRYANSGEEGKTVASSLYLQNDAFNALGKPESISIVVSAVSAS